jgi:small-conductance mechanosensitive channel
MWFWSIVILCAAVVPALVAHAIFYNIAERVARRTRGKLDDSLWAHSRRPAQWLVALVAATLIMPLTLFPDRFSTPFQHVLLLADIGVAAWLLVALTRVAEDFSTSRFASPSSDNLAARRLQTQVVVLRRIISVIVILVAIGFMLMTFPNIRHFGETVFASAGIAGIIVGLAARPTISSLLAGVQIAFTQPIRIDDVVVVEGEWGRIEEIETTYVVVRIWDQRRLVLPLTYFIEKPFQNWTRQTSQILGTAFFYVDYSVPVDTVRQELLRILESSPLWDRQVCGLQVTNTSDKTIELRALMSSSDSSQNFDLRCLVRERLVAFLQENYPTSLPQVRGQMLVRAIEDRAEREKAA